MTDPVASLFSRLQHPLLHPTALHVRFARDLGEFSPGPDLGELHRPDPDPSIAGVPAELRLDEDERESVRSDVRDLLRHDGYKPTGRGKPSSEYLVRAAADGAIPRINPAVDACNAVSLHSGLPISVVDLGRVQGAPFVRVCDRGTYVFNASGQEMRLDGLLCLFDGRGPIANAVKDSHRTKTGAMTTETLWILWTPKSQAARAERTKAWLETLLEPYTH